MREPLNLGLYAPTTDLPIFIRLICEARTCTPDDKGSLEV